MSKLDNPLYKAEAVLVTNGFQFWVIINLATKQMWKYVPQGSVLEPSSLLSIDWYRGPRDITPTRPFIQADYNWFNSLE